MVEHTFCQEGSLLLGPIVVGRQLRVCIIAGEFSFNGGDMRLIIAPKQNLYKNQYLLITR
jgi:hypothetical protein